MSYGVPGKETIYRKEADEIKALIDKIAQLDGVTTSFQFGMKGSTLNEADRNFLNLANELADRIITLANLSHQNDLPLVNRTYFKNYGYNIKDELDSFLESFNFYKMIDNSVNHLLISYAEKISTRFRLGKKDTIKYSSYIADAYFDIGEEKKATDIVYMLIDKFPSYDEPYQVLLNWYMYKAVNISNLEKAVRSAHNNKHRLVGGDFAYVKLLDYYRGKDDKKYAYYRDLHKKHYNQI